MRRGWEESSRFLTKQRKWRSFARTCVASSESIGEWLECARGCGWGSLIIARCPTYPFLPASVEPPPRQALRAGGTLGGTRYALGSESSASGNRQLHSARRLGGRGSGGQEAGRAAEARFDLNSPPDEVDVNFDARGIYAVVATRREGAFLFSTLFFYFPYGPTDINKARGGAGSGTTHSSHSLYCFF